MQTHVIRSPKFKNLRRWKVLLAVLITPTLLYVGWGRENSSVFLIFVCLLPVLAGEHYLCTRKTSKYLIGFTSIAIFHLLTGFQIFTDVEDGKILTILLANSVLLSIPWAIYIQIKSTYDLELSLFIFVVSWIALEYLTTHSTVLTPWFDLGNSLGGYPQLIQWYEFTGVSGGTLWILLVNVTTFCCIYRLISTEYHKLISAVIILLFCSLAPKVISDRTNFEEKGRKIKVALIGINEDPLHSVINVTFDEILTAINSPLSVQATYIFWPESAITVVLDKPLTDESFLISTVRNVLKPETKYVVGGVTLRHENILHNAAILVSADESYVYIKQKLVPFAEFNPLPLVPWFKVLRESPSQFTSSKNLPYSEASMGLGVCYESLFGELISRNCLESQCQLIAILSNERWTPGATENLMNASAVRAIETRKYVVRSTINGIASVITPRGQLLASQRANSRIEMLTSEIIPNREITFYMKHGDVIGELSLVLMVIFSLMTFWKTGTH